MNEITSGVAVKAKAGYYL